MDTEGTPAAQLERLILEATGTQAPVRKLWNPGHGTRLALLPLLGSIPSFLLATYSLTQPWARARFLLLLGITRSPEAVVLVITTLTAMIAATVVMAARRRLRLAAGVHALMGLAMCVVAWFAFRMVREAGFKLLILPITTVHPARGLHLWVVASLGITLLGAIELGVAKWRQAPQIRPPAPRASGGGAGRPGAAPSGVGERADAVDTVGVH